MNDNQQLTRRNFIFYNNLSSCVAHILLAFLPAIVAPVTILELAPLQDFFNITYRYADMLGMHVAIMHILGWYRRLRVPNHAPQTKRKIRNWISLIILAFVINLCFYIFYGASNFNVILDLILMCLAYFNGIFAAGYFSKFELTIFKPH